MPLPMISRSFQILKKKNTRITKAQSKTPSGAREYLSGHEREHVACDKRAKL